MVAQKPKKKPAAKSRTTQPAKSVVIDTSELIADGANPRQIKADAAKGLSNSLDRFGDLSGIVWNQRTGELVSGHQRIQQIRARWGDRPIEMIDAVNRLYGIRVDDGHFFGVRVVDWSKAMQRAANVAANNHKIAGEFTDDMATFLLEIEGELTAEAPGLLDDVLLVDLMAAGLDTSDATEAVQKEPIITESYQIIVQCSDEAHQRRVYDELTKEGLACKVLTL